MIGGAIPGTDDPPRGAGDIRDPDGNKPKARCMGRQMGPSHPAPSA